MSAISHILRYLPPLGDGTHAEIKTRLCTCLHVRPNMPFR